MLSRQVVFCVSLIVATPIAAQEAVSPAPSPQQSPSSILRTSLNEPNKLSTAATDGANSATSSNDRSLLKQKQIELDGLQREVDQLRKESGDAQQILVGFKILEVNLTGLRRLGIDIPLADESTRKDKGGVSVPVASKRDSFQFNIVSADRALQYLEVLQQSNLSRVLAEPTVVALNQRRASFQSGGEFPIPADPSSNKPFHFQNFGTEIGVQPEILGNNKVRLDFRTRISEPDYAKTITIAGTKVPSLNVRQIESGCEMSFGQTLILAGLTRERTMALLSETGRRDEVVEIQLMVLITPEEVTTLR